MNIKQATEQIEGAIEAYLLKDNRGLYKIPPHMQRPIIMLGPPGVGKTAIVSQIADRMGLNFVSYSITHHTRQSALGLPFIEQKTFGGQEYSISEYTMSEIIAAVYSAIEASGVDEGVLFLDEVNCVSETLAPAMLQFLQYKTFGQHKLPTGWVIVTAGNPPEYNRSAREFDPAMMDRLKKINVEPSLKVWQEYAQTRGLHPAVLTYLDSKPGNFYSVNADVSGTKIVTARGWEDLSRMLAAYESIGRSADVELVEQYIQDKNTAEDFALYYDLFCKYSDDYKVREIMLGKVADSIKTRAKDAAFDERVALVGLLIDAICGDVREVMIGEAALRDVRDDVLELRLKLDSMSAAGLDGTPASASGSLNNSANASNSENASDSTSANVNADTTNPSNPPNLTSPIEAKIKELKTTPEVRKQSSSAADKQQVKAQRLAILSKLQTTLSAYLTAGSTESKPPNAFDAIKATFNSECSLQIENAKKCSAQLDNIMHFLTDVYGDGQETLIFITKISTDPTFMKFASEHASDDYLKHNKDLLFLERGISLLREAKNLQNL